jgi:hypothetical protein
MSGIKQMTDHTNKKLKKMKTKIAGTIVAIMLLVSAKGNTTDGDPYMSSIYSLRANIRNVVSSLVVSLNNNEDSETYLISFQVDEDNRMMITNIAGDDQYIIMQIGKKLQNLKAEGVFDHNNTYKVKVTFKKAGE